DVYGPFLNSQKQNSNIGLIMDKAFSGTSDFGVNTGTNAGAMPDAVLLTNLSVEKNEVAQLRLTGLDQTKRYRIGFSGSNTNYGYNNTTYTIGNRTVYLNSYNNAT